MISTGSPTMQLYQELCRRGDTMILLDNLVLHGKKKGISSTSRTWEITKPDPEQTWILLDSNSRIVEALQNSRIRPPEHLPWPLETNSKFQEKSIDSFSKSYFDVEYKKTSDGESKSVSVLLGERWKVKGRELEPLWCKKKLKTVRNFEMHG